MKLIEKEWLEDLLLAHEQNARSIEASGRKASFTYADGIRTAYADVGLCPIVDAVVVVRCGDCKHWKLSEYNTYGIHICKKFSGVRGEHDFCSRGEREGEDRNGK